MNSNAAWRQPTFVVDFKILTILAFMAILAIPAKSHLVQCGETCQLLFVTSYPPLAISLCSRSFSAFAFAFEFAFTLLFTLGVTPWLRASVVDVVFS